MCSIRPVEAHHVKKGQFVILKNRPCRVAQVKQSKPGKHGTVKCNITGFDVFTSKRYNEVYPGHIAMYAFDPHKGQYEVCDAKYTDNGDLSVLILDDSNDNEIHCRSVVYPYSSLKDNTDRADMIKFAEKFKAYLDGMFFEVTITTAPFITASGDACVESAITEWKQIKD